MHTLTRIGYVLVSMCVATTVTASDCQTNGLVIGGTVNRGGYQFEYESREGVNCREYRIRNKPGRPLTPVKWEHDDSVFIDTNLPACRRNTACDWTTAVQRSVERNKLPTQIGFGINKDEYTEKPVALVEARQIANALPSDELYATLSGVVADASGRSAELEFSFQPEQFGDELLVNYSAQQTPSWRGSRYPIVIRWGAGTTTFYSSELEPGTAKVARFQVAINAAGCDESEPSIITATQGGRIIAQTSAPSPCTRAQ